MRTSGHNCADFERSPLARWVASVSRNGGRGCDNWVNMRLKTEHDASPRCHEKTTSFAYGAQRNTRIAVRTPWISSDFAVSYAKEMGPTYCLVTGPASSPLVTFVTVLYKFDWRSSWRSSTWLFNRNFSETASGERPKPDLEDHRPTSKYPLLFNCSPRGDFAMTFFLNIDPNPQNLSFSGLGPHVRIARSTIPFFFKLNSLAWLA